MAVGADSGLRLLEHAQLPERYIVIDRIATGGMASLWRAHDDVLGRHVAIKLLSESLSEDPAAMRRFKREALAAARLSSHPNVVTIYDVGGHQREGGCAFIVMEYLPGGTVSDTVRLGPASTEETIRWLREAAAALDYAHSHGVVHRDVKLANFLLDDDRVLHVGDFGIAQLGEHDTFAGSGELLGTPSYLAPERALGQPATAASDRYSLAVAAFELLTGERPFTASHWAAQARQHVEDEPPPASARNSSLPAGLDEVLAKGMAKPPEDRWPTATAFAQAVEQALRGEGAGLASTQSLPVIARAGSRSRPGRGLIAVALVATIVAIGILVATLPAGSGRRGPSGESVAQRSVLAGMQSKATVRPVSRHRQRATVAVTTSTAPEPVPAPAPVSHSKPHRKPPSTPQPSSVKPAKASPAGGGSYSGGESDSGSRPGGSGPGDGAGHHGGH